MDYNKINEFIKKLRKEKKWSQEKLADMLYVDRTTIARWENGKRQPDLDMLTRMSEIFDVSINEMIAGERINDNNQTTIQNSFYEYTTLVIKSMNKWKKIGIFLIFFLVVFFILFSIIYFMNNYKSIKVYSFSGDSENYTVDSGMLVITKETIYFMFGTIEPMPKTVTIYKLENGENKILYEGGINNIIIDFYGYDSFLDYNQLDNCYLKIENDVMKLNFNLLYENNGFFYHKNFPLGDNYKSIDTQSVQEQISKKFICEDSTCNYTIGDTSMSYDLLTKTYTVINENEIYIYSLDTNLFQYEYLGEPNVKFYIENDKTFCQMGDCSKSNEIFNKFKKEYVEEYLK